jgi:arsenate reductase
MATVKKSNSTKISVKKKPLLRKNDLKSANSETLVMYHKSNCATSLEVLRLIKKKKVKNLQIIHYLETPPTVGELKKLLKLLKLKAEDVIRKKEKIYKENFADKNLSEEEWIKVICENPILLERPILVKGKKALIARPIERVNEMI